MNFWIEKTLPNSFFFFFFMNWDTITTVWFLQDYIQLMIRDHRVNTTVKYELVACSHRILLKHNLLLLCSTVPCTLATQSVVADKQPELSVT